LEGLALDGLLDLRLANIKFRVAWDAQ